MPGFYKDTSGGAEIPQPTAQTVPQKPIDEAASLNEIRLRAQPRQQQQGVLFARSSNPFWRYGSGGHPACG